MLVDRWVRCDDREGVGLGKSLSINNTRYTSKRGGGRVGYLVIWKLLRASSISFKGQRKLNCPISVWGIKSSLLSSPGLSLPT